MSNEREKLRERLREVAAFLRSGEGVDTVADYERHAATCDEALALLTQTKEPVARRLVADTLHDAYIQGYDHAAAGKDALDVDAFIEAGVMLTSRLTQAQEPVGRVESGPVRVGDDWAGVFIRGDQAMSRSIQIRGVAEEYEQNGSPLIAANLNGFADLLASCREPCDATTLYASPVASGGGDR